MDGKERSSKKEKKTKSRISHRNKSRILKVKDLNLLDFKTVLSRMVCSDPSMNPFLNTYHVWLFVPLENNFKPRYYSLFSFQYSSY